MHQWKPCFTQLGVGAMGACLLLGNPSEKVLNEIDIWFSGGLVINVTLPECAPMTPLVVNTIEIELLSPIAAYVDTK